MGLINSPFDYNYTLPHLISLSFKPPFLSHPTSTSHLN